MAEDSQGSSHHLKVVGGAYGKRKDLIYESTRKKLYYQLIEKDQQALIYFIDMDFMKKTNDLYGHDMGDSAIKEIASIILKVISKEDIAIRYGGDEFIIITNYSSKDLSTKITDEVFSFLNTHIPQVIIKIRNDSLNFLGFYV